MENPANTADKQKASNTSGKPQALQVVTGPMTDPSRHSTFSDTSVEEISLALLGAIRQIVSAAIREQVAALAPAHMATPFDVEAPKEETREAVPIPAPPTVRRMSSEELQDMQYQIGGAPGGRKTRGSLHGGRRTPAITEYDGTTDPTEHLAHFEIVALLYRYTDGIKCRVFVTTFARAAQQWFNLLPPGTIGSFQEFRSLFLHQFVSSRKLQKTELSLFAVRQKDNEPLKEYLQIFNAAALEVPSAT
ncbi:UNVERIFIED_CONTAM: hypothetical protein Sradi_4042600 [Sesamum radiatum]|uniref:Retrotransposon gag domain-containing protein n=1 Tax=Sesamum radiatum TaxID=300843 RepID=A0AAW2PJB0_SESRA